MTTKTRKPRLTKKAIKDLRAMMSEARGSLNATMEDHDESQEAACRGLVWLERFLAAAESRKENP